MAELSFRPTKEPGVDGIPPDLSVSTKAAIEEAARTLAPEIALHLEAELRARLVHVALHLPDESQELVVRSRPISPFFEVTTRRI